ncbi:MAG TPA: acyl-CoA dehydrogenase family protein [Pyrinomonadaceae bacterium]|jgi:alkylation response protein AidB-like acyl-CoA dehydrogenase
MVSTKLTNYDQRSELKTEQQDIIERVGNLARENFAKRAAHYDQTATFPSADFDDLFRAGLLAPVVPKEYGGLGLGPYRGDVLTLWMMTKEIAKANLSLARCWEGHVNSLVLLDGMATEAQQERWFQGVVRRGDKWVAWSGEPQARAPGEKVRFGTTVTKVPGGYVIEGNKVFSTSASGAQWAILLVNTEGPGGARHSTASVDSQLLMACNLSDPTVEIDDSWWDPIGMRATVSYLVNFRRTFIADSDLIGYPGQYLKEGWQTCFIPHYAASFLGAAEAAFDYARDYVTTQNKTEDPYVQHHIGQMSVNVETAHLWLKHVAHLWETGNYQEAQIAGSRARHVVEHLAEDTVKHCIRACGARCLNRPSALERIYRDLSFYVRHDNDDHILAMIGKSVLGLTHDPSFYKP